MQNVYKQNGVWKFDFNELPKKTITLLVLKERKCLDKEISLLYFRLGKHSGSDKLGANVDTSLIHKALFKTSAREESSRPVTFTVKI